MRPTLRHVWWTIGAGLVLASPAAVGAQQPLAPVQISEPLTKADRLDARAAAYEQSGSLRHWGRAASLRERAAGMRAAHDPRGSASLEQAAFDRHAIGERAAARDLMARAAEQAIARGDVYRAARAYVNVAYIAAEMRDGPRVRQFVERGTLLMHSPQLSGSEREALRRGVAAVSAPGLTVAQLATP